MLKNTQENFDPAEVRDGLLIVVNYNQEREIQAYLARVDRYFPKQQIVIVDDGSTDESPVIAELAGFTVIRHARNLGIGAAIRTGIAEARQRGRRWVLISSSNGKIRPEDFRRVYGPVVAGEADYTTGSRFVAGGGHPGLPLFRRVSIPLFSLAASLWIGRWYTDITCGFRAYTLDILERSAADLQQDWLNRYELEYYIHYYVSQLPNVRIQEVPVTIDYAHLEKGRTSKIKPLVGWWSMIRPIVLLRLGLRK